MNQAVLSQINAGFSSEIRMFQALATETLNIGPEDVLIARDVASMAGEYTDPGLHILLLLMLDALNRGSLCLPLDTGCFNPALVKNSAHAQAIFSALETGRWDAVVSHGPDPEFKPLVLWDRRIYFHRYFEVEHGIRNSIARLNTRPWTVDARATARALKDALDASIWPLDPVQARAVAMALVRGFSIISGGPGTGKTTVAATIVDAVMRLNMLTGGEHGKIRLAAPTGRAAARLEASVKGSLENTSTLNPQVTAASTIHRLLGIGRSAYSWQRNRFRPLTASFILIDEASMVDAVLMARLLENTPDSCRLVLMGDRNQLPSVEAGAVLSDLVLEDVSSADSETRELLKAVLPEEYHEAVEQSADHEALAGTSDQSVPVTVLERSYRSVTEIWDAALAIRNAGFQGAARAFSCFKPLKLQEAVAGRVPESGAWFIDPGGSSDALMALLRAWFRDAFLNRPDSGSVSCIELLREFYPDPSMASDTGVQKRLREISGLMENSRALCLTHTGFTGTRGVNQVASSIVRAALPPCAPGHLFHGALVMTVENDYARGIFNGDVGLVLGERGSDSLNVWFCMPEGEFRVFPAAVCRALVPAFAITVHKSQGSEYNRVMLLLPEDEEHRLLSREILYTGITRAREAVVVAGSRKAFINGVSRQIERYSGFSSVKSEQ